MALEFNPLTQDSEFFVNLNQREKLKQRLDAFEKEKSLNDGKAKLILKDLLAYRHGLSPSAKNIINTRHS